MARHASLAEHYRAHREVFLLAQELGCTPKCAELVLRKRRVEALREENRRKAAALASRNQFSGSALASDEPAGPHYWWKEEDR